GTAAGIVLRAHRAPVRLRRLAHDRQPQTRSGQSPRGRSPVEAIEHPWQIVRRDPRAVVSHLEVPLVNPYLDRTLWWTPLRGVGEQVGDRAVESRGDGTNKARLRVEHEAASRRVQPGTLERRRDGEVQADVLHLELLDLGLREVDEIAHEYGQLPQL